MALPAKSGKSLGSATTKRPAPQPKKAGSLGKGAKVSKVR